MPDVDELWQRAEAMPYGAARSAALEEVLRLLPEHDLDRGYRVRLKLIGAYHLGGEASKMMVPFTWCVTENDKDPARFADLLDDLLWTFKWVPNTLLGFPEVDRAFAYATLDDMERRYRARGHSMHPVHALRCSVALHVGDLDRAADEYRRWVAAPRGPLSDCIGCDPTDKVIFLGEHRRYDEALAVAVPVLDGELTCVEQPQAILTHLLPAYVHTGHHELAARALRRAYAVDRGKRAATRRLAHQIRFCAQTGNEQQALEVAASHLHLLESPNTPADDMWFSAASAHALRRAAELDPSANVQGRSVRELADELADRASALAARFDERNGTTHQSGLVRSWLDAEPWTDLVPLSEQARRTEEQRRRRKAARTPDGRAGADPAAEMQVPRGDELAAIDTDGLLDQADAHRFKGRIAHAAALWAEFARRVPEQERTASARGRLAEGQAFRALSGGDPASARAAFQTALVDYESAGDEDRQDRVRARLCLISLAENQREEAAAIGLAPLERLAADPGPRSDHWRLALARLRLALGDLDEAEQLLARMGEVDSDLQPDVRRTHGDVLLAQERAEEAVVQFRAAVDSVGDEGPALPELLWRLGRALLQSGDAEAARAELIEAAAAAAGVELPTAWLHADLAEAYLRAGQPEEAILTGEAALFDVRDAGDDDVEIYLRQVLVAAYREMSSDEAGLVHIRELRRFGEDNPQWQAGLLLDEGLALRSLERHDEALSAFAGAAELLASGDLSSARLRAMREVADSADAVGDRARADGLRAEIRALVGAAPAREPWHDFHLAGTAHDAAHAAATRGDPASALRDAQLAEDGYRSLGIPELVADALLLQLEAGGTVDADAVRSVWEDLEKGADGWYQLGWWLSDLLTQAGETPAAEQVRAALEAGEHGPEV